MQDGENVTVKLSNPALMSGRRLTWAEIDLDNLVKNLALMKEAVGPGVAIMPALKADAYGHGAIVCAHALEEAGADWFGVALPEEGLVLRDSGISRPILCLGGFWEGQEDLLAARDLTPVIFRLGLLERLNQQGKKVGRVLEYHLKVDTGMGRLGLPFEQLGEFLDAAAGLSNVKLDGVMAHFASADMPEKGEFTRGQMARFEAAVWLVRSRGHLPGWTHQANSAAAHAIPAARGNIVRLGGAIYGLWRDTTNPTVEVLPWQPVMSLHTRVTYKKTVPAGTALGYGSTYVTSRESRIAILPVGYADGLRRALSNCGRVLVRGQFAPIIGRVSMDLTIVDVTDIPGVEIDDEAVIIGRQGGLEITAEEMATQIGTIAYEVTCGISDRVPRVYIRQKIP